jgi:hypothetical protein
MLLTKRSGGNLRVAHEDTNKSIYLDFDMKAQIAWSPAQVLPLNEGLRMVLEECGFGVTVMTPSPDTMWFEVSHRKANFELSIGAVRHITQGNMLALTVPSQGLKREVELDNFREVIDSLLYLIRESWVQK